MNSEILSKEVQQYINDNLSVNIHKILLKKSVFPKVTAKELVDQIESKIKSKQKLPTWFCTKNIYYPNKINLSQTSSETTANYKATLIQGNLIADITAGLGIDSFAFSKRIKQVLHVEKNESLSKIAKHNFKQLGIDNIECIPNDGISYLKETTQLFDWIYIDPSRRDKDNKKVYFLTDCEPDVTIHLEFLLSKSTNIMIKTGPLLDINSGLNQISNVKEIHIVAVHNDVKELLWIIQKNYSDQPIIKTVNFKNNITKTFEFTQQQEDDTITTLSLPKQYLYEPNAAILKSGAFKYLGKFYNLAKLHPNSHLYTSDVLIDFPGRVFKVIEIMDYAKKSVNTLNISKANITTRNFPDSVSKIRKKLKLKDGGDNYLFCTTNIFQKLVLVFCKQIFENKQH